MAGPGRILGDAMGRTGRPIRPIEKIEEPIDHILWLIRVHRLHGSDPTMRSNAAFARTLERHAGGGHFTPERVSRLEGAGQSEALTARIITAYEFALGLDEGTLTSLYSYLRRNHLPASGATAGPSRPVDMTDEDHDLLYLASMDGRLSPHQWSLVGRYFPAVRSRTQRRRIRERIAAELPVATGGEFPHLREAASLIGRSMVDPLVEALCAAPVRAAQPIETLGVMREPAALQKLSTLIFDPPDLWTLRALLEAYTRLVRSFPVWQTERDTRKLPGFLARLAYDPDLGHTIRQQAAVLLAASIEGSDRDRYAKRLLGSGDLDVIQVFLPAEDPIGTRLARVQNKILDDVLTQVREDHLPEPLHGAAVLRALLRAALFAKERWEREEGARVLAASPFAAALAAALGGRLRQSRDRHEHQRSMALVLARLGQPSSAEILQTVLSEPGRHRSVHVTAAWFLGELPTTRLAVDQLADSFAAHPSAEVRRGLIYAAGRACHRPLLVAGLRDADAGVAADARFWLSGPGSRRHLPDSNQKG